MWWIRQNIRSSINENGRTIRIPSNLIQEEQKFKKIVNIKVLIRNIVDVVHVHVLHVVVLKNVVKIVGKVFLWYFCLY